MKICDKCDKQCDEPCAAVKELHKIYDQTKHEEKNNIIKNLRNLLDICDAEPSEEMTELSIKIIDKFPEFHFIRDFDIKVGYVLSYENKPKKFGDCRKVNKVYGAYLPFDFIITFYEPSIAMLSENQIKLLMYHELRHIGMGDKGLMIVPHDIEDFLDITDYHGTRWTEFEAEVKNIL